jgi:exodeoxyribonuclease VII large subunit
MVTLTVPGGAALSVSNALRLVSEPLRATSEQTIAVMGEVCDWRKWKAFAFCTITDGQSRISVVLPPAAANLLSAAPKPGSMVVVRGRWEIYAPRGAIQLVASWLRSLDQEGERRALVARNRAELAAEGLVDRDRRLVPADPAVIGVVAAPFSDALADVIAAVRERAAWVRLVVAHSAVQGAHAEKELPRAIRLLEQASPRPDAIIVTRGGGSDGDLWVFNTLGVARAISEASVPTVTAIGHASDSTLADLVADHTAATPSAAAAIVTPDGAAILSQLAQMREELHRCALQAVSNTTADLVLTASLATSAIVSRSAAELAEWRALRTQTLPELIGAKLASIWSEARTSAAELQKGVQTVLRERTSVVDGMQDELRRLAGAGFLNGQLADLAVMKAQLQAFSPYDPLSRGYAMLAGRAGQVRSVAELQSGERLTLLLADGDVVVTVESTRLTQER